MQQQQQDQSVDSLHLAEVSRHFALETEKSYNYLHTCSSHSWDICWSDGEIRLTNICQAFQNFQFQRIQKTTVLIFTTVLKICQPVFGTRPETVLILSVLLSSCFRSNMDTLSWCGVLWSEKSSTTFEIRKTRFTKFFSPNTLSPALSCVIDF